MAQASVPALEFIPPWDAGNFSPASHLLRGSRSRLRRSSCSKEIKKLNVPNALFPFLFVHQVTVSGNCSNEHVADYLSFEARSIIFPSSMISQLPDKGKTLRNAEGKRSASFAEVPELGARITQGGPDPNVLPNSA